MANTKTLHWLDTDGKPIQAYRGGVLFHNGIYYWYSENKDTLTVQAYRNSETDNEKEAFDGISEFTSSI